MRKLDLILNSVIWGFIRAWIGCSIYKYLDFCAHPDLYITWSAPWYTSIQIHAVVTLVIVIAAVIAKWVIHRKQQARQGQ